MTPAQLRAIVEASGLSVRRFAVLVVSRDERTVRRWLTGEIEIPAVAAAWLRRLKRVQVGRASVRLTLRL